MAVGSRVRAQAYCCSKLEKITQGLPFGYCEGTKCQNVSRKCEDRIWSFHGCPILRALCARVGLLYRRKLRAPMPSTHKKVIVRKHDRDSISGYVAPSNFVVDGKLELLNTSGNVVAVDLRHIKAVDFVREFSDSDLMLRKTSTARPKTVCLLVRLKFTATSPTQGLLPS